MTKFTISKSHFFTNFTFFKHQILSNFWIKSCFLSQCDWQRGEIIHVFLWFQEINIGLVYVNLPVNSYLAFVPVCNYLAIFPTAYTPMELECHHLPPPRPLRQTVKTCQRSPWSISLAKTARKRPKNRTMSWCQLWHWKCQIRIFN